MFVVPSEREDAFPGDHLEPPLLATLRFDVTTIDPDRQGPFASANLNRAYLCGTEAGMDFDSVARLIELFANEGVKRFFVWLSPGPNMDVVRRWLEGSGLSRIQCGGQRDLRWGRIAVLPFLEKRIRQAGRNEGRGLKRADSNERAH